MTTARPPAPRKPEHDALRDALAAHDRRIAACGLDIWVGAEPTFTDRAAETPEWLGEALGGDKYARAERMLRHLAERAPGCAVLRPLGRRYAAEPAPRWCMGVYARRDGRPPWQGPPDPALLDAPESAAESQAADLAEALLRALSADGLPAVCATADGPLEWRVAWRPAGDAPHGWETAWAITGPPPSTAPAEGGPPADALAGSGTLLIAVGCVDAGDGRRVLQTELPAADDTAQFCTLLALLAGATRELGVNCLRIGGFPPPADPATTWTSLTPDPGVVEANLAPAPDSAALADTLDMLGGAAEAAGLHGFRLHYNGLHSDSGGGGQVTLGGPTPAQSPFFRAPRLLPAMLRYFNRHPSLSYWFAPESCGAAGQAPRADEGTAENLAELALALALLDAGEAPRPATLWASLAPFLADTSGNRHRAEINLEKLWNAALGARGCMGLVEFRAFRMSARPRQLAAVAALLRGLAAMLSGHGDEGPLLDWGAALHDRWSLPFHLRADLEEVLAELDAAGFGLPAAAAQTLLDDGERRLAELALPGATLVVSRAVEFWPLLGDVASQEASGARLVDASTARVELVLRAGAEGDAWQARVAGRALPLHAAQDRRGAARVAGIRYRTFVPIGGLHPTVPAHAPLTVDFGHPRHGRFRLLLHEWQPGGGPYPGLPADAWEARARRAARCVLQALPADTPPLAACAPGQRHVLDLRQPPLGPAGPA